MFLRLRWAILPLTVGLLCGCAAPARIDQMAISAADLSRVSAPSALRANVAIRDVTGGKETNPLWMSNVSSADFEQALEASLRAAGILAPNRMSGRYVLTAHLENLDVPMVGIDMTVTATVHYILSERSTGKDVYVNKVTQAYTAKFSDAVLGVERLKLANEGAMRVNITQFLEALSRAKIAWAGSTVLGLR